MIERPTRPGPYIARSASSRRDDWPLWYVAGPDGVTNYLTCLGGRSDRGEPFTSREHATQLAEIWNG